MFGIRLKLKQGPMYGYCDPTSGAMIGSGVLGYMGQQQAQSSAESMNRQQMAQQQRQWELSDPFSATGQRGKYVGQLNDLMKGGFQGIQDDPMYKWMSAQGLQAAQRGAAATGTAQSGQEQIALQQQGYGLARSFFQDQYSRLAELSGATSKTSGPGPGGISPQNMYEMSMGGTAAIGGIARGVAGMFGSPSSGEGSQGSVDMTGFQTPTSAQFGPEAMSYTPSYMQ